RCRRRQRESRPSAQSRRPGTCCSRHSGRSRSTAGRDPCLRRCRGAPAVATACSRAKVSVRTPMSTLTLDVDAVRARFSALKAPTAYFDAPGGTQVPDSVIDAISAYLRESNANLGGAFRTSRSTDALLAQARLAAAAFLRCEPGEAFFGANMTTLNFMLSRTVGRTLREGDEILVTRLDHDGNVSPWLEVARDVGATVGFVEISADTTLDYDDLARQLTDRTRVVSFPLASNAVGTLNDVQPIVELAHRA